MKGALQLQGTEYKKLLTQSALYEGVLYTKKGDIVLSDKVQIL